MSELPTYKVYAIRYATRPAQRRDHFLFGDPHEGDMPMDYYVWAIVGDDRAIVVDTGFSQEVADQRARTFLRCPVDTLNQIGIDPDRVEDVILTHLHYDHVGNFDRFAIAKFHLQESEIHYAVGKNMKHDFLAHPFHVDDIVGVVRLNYAKRVKFYEGPAEVAPGISIHPVGGHSVGLQFVKVNTAAGTLILASDVAHFYEHLETRRLFPGLVSAPDMFAAFEAVEEAAGPQQHIVPGHDPLVMQLYPAPSPELEGIAVRLDGPPPKRGTKTNKV